jgi:hypothetical protein
VFRCLLAAGSALALVAAACAQPLPEDRSASALYRDLQRLVSVHATQGWQVDRIEVDAILGDALQSVCRTPLDARASLDAWIAERIAALGGPVEKAYADRGSKLGEVDDLLELTRIRRVLRTANHAAPEDCPFWATPQNPFLGLQIADDRFLLVLEGGGKLIGLRSEGQNDFAGGGAGRVLVGHTLGPRWGLLVGAELGGSGELRRDAFGDRNLVLAFDAVFPLVVRYRFVNSYLDLEPGYLLHVSEDDATARHGVHLGAAFGVKTVRTRWFIPGLALGVSLERVPSVDVWYVKIGGRVTFDFDL